jgi:hypothetical protein
VRAWVGLAAVAALSALIHAAAIRHARLPAQDGLKYIRTARAFQTADFKTAVRNADHHPLYPALIALVQPLASAVAGPGPDSWRLAAQGVSAASSVVTLLPLFLLARRLHGARAGLLTVFLATLLPIPMEFGRDTLSDPLALLLAVTSLERGSVWLEQGKVRAAWGSGLACGLGYWTRPEVALVGLVLALIGLTRSLVRPRHEPGPTWPQAAWIAAPMLVLIAGYAVTKGSVSEKLALRIGLGLPPASPPAAKTEPTRAVIPPKEEPELGPQPLSVAFRELAVAWLRLTGIVLTPLILAGAWLAPPSRTRDALRLYLLVFLVLLIRHHARLGYLSMRYLLTPVVVTLPWAGWRLLRLLERLGDWLRLEGGRRRVAASFALILMLAGGLAAQAKPSHPSRRAHWEAGRWLAGVAPAGSAVLDTRGWAAFVADLPAYGPWHFGQAESDPRLAFVIVEKAELVSGSHRARMLNDWLEGRTRLIAEFGDSQTDAVCVFGWLGSGGGA